VWS
ncbi:acrB/AcrD/AcrF family protein, partial [Vibrio parahaemolyticus AQ3810]|jgi:hypothetical protein